jgi:S-methylmethionine-dependent homocysteine/selenocysteine methylase
MSKYRNNLPQLSHELFLTDGGLETTLIFDNGYDLPEFAAFDLLKHAGGYEALRNYYLAYVNIAKANAAGFILESATWRASRDWGAKLGYGTADLKDVNRAAIALLQELRNEYESDKTPIVISGCLGPRGDGYDAAEKMTAEEAEQYHGEQIATLSKTEADLVSAFTINYAEEAVGISKAAASAGIPVVISFTVETDGRLPSGQSLGEAIKTVDQATANGPAYYMINCAHPTHFKDALTTGEPWVERIRAIRANASTKSHAELDEAEELDDGDPADLGARYAELKDQLQRLNVFGGCCGTDHRHVEEICNAVKSII